MSAVTLGIVAHTPAEARAAAEELGVVVVKAQVKAGGRGKAGGVKLAKTPDEAEQHAEAILGHGDQGPDRQPGADRPGREHRGGVLLLVPARPGQPAVPLHRVGRGRRRDRRGRQDQPGRGPQDPDRPGHRRRRGQGARDRRGREVPRGAHRAGRHHGAAACGTSSSAEDATLVEVNPLARLEGDVLEALDGKVSLDDNADFRHEEHAAFEIREEADPLEAKAKDKGLNYVKLDGAVGIIGNGAGLVMSTLDVVAYAGEKHGGVEARQLPRHRWRRQRPGDGRRPRRDPPRRAGEVGVRQRLRRHHRLRRGRQRHRRRAGHPRRRGHQADRRTTRRQQRRGGPAHPLRGEPRAGHDGRHHGRRGGPAAELAAKSERA